jgi:probable O-glycosylation ligase (exosortase A-associated)
MEKGLIFTWVLTCGGALVALFDPFYGLLAYIALAILRPDSLWFWAVEPSNYARYVGVAMLVGWALKGFGSWQFGRARGVVFALIAFWVWMVLAAVPAVDPPSAWDSVRFHATIVLPFLVGITTINSVARLKLLAWLIVLAEGYVAFELNLQYRGGFNRVYEDGFGSLDSNSVAIGMVTCVGLAFFLGLEAPKWWQKGLAFVAALLMGHVVLISYSRGGMLAGAVLGGVAFVLIPKKAKHYAAFAAAAVVVLALAGEGVRARFLNTFDEAAVQRDSSAQTRLQMWRDCLDSMSKRPVLGVGPRCWPVWVRSEYGVRGQVDEAHTLWLQTGAQIGLPGLAFLLAFYGLCLWRLWPYARGKLPAADPWVPDAARMVIAALVGFAVSVQFVTLEALETPYYIALIGAGLLKLTSVPSAAPAAPPPGGVPALVMRPGEQNAPVHA